MPNVNKAKFTVKGHSQDFDNSQFKFMYAYKFQKAGGESATYVLSTISHTAGSVNTNQVVAESSEYFRNCTAYAIAYLTNAANTPSDYNDLLDFDPIASSVQVSEVTNVEAPTGTYSMNFRANRGDIGSWRRRTSDDGLFNFFHNGGTSPDYDLAFTDSSSNVIPGMTLSVDVDNEEIYITYQGNVTGNVTVSVTPKSGAAGNFIAASFMVSLESLVVNAPDITVTN